MPSGRESRSLNSLQESVRGQPVIFEPEPPEVLSRLITPGSSNPCPGGKPSSSGFDSTQRGPGTRHWPIGLKRKLTADHDGGATGGDDDTAVGGLVADPGGGKAANHDGGGAFGDHVWRADAGAHASGSGGGQVAD